MQLRTNCRNIVVVGTLLIWTIKFFVRPYLHPSGTTGFLLGVAPNLFGSFLIPFAAHWLYTQRPLNPERRLRFSILFDTRFICISGFLLLVVNEYLQLIPFFGRRFDYFDILFSAVGLLVSFYSFSFLQRRTLIRMSDQQ